MKKKERTIKNSTHSDSLDEEIKKQYPNDVAIQKSGEAALHKKFAGTDTSNQNQDMSK